MLINAVAIVKVAVVMRMLNMHETRRSELASLESLTVSSLRYGMFALSAFVLLYFESIHLGSVKVAVLWKALLLVYAIAYASAKARGEIPGVVCLGVLFAVKLLMNYGLSDGMAQQLEAFSKALSLPVLIWMFWAMDLPLERLRRVLLFLVVFISLSSVPFFCGLNSLSTGYDISLFGDEGRVGFIGFYQNEHGASTSYALAVITIVFLLRCGASKSDRLVLYGCLGVSLLCLISTYVRTGLLMVVVGLVGMAAFSGKHALSRVLAVLTVSMCVMGLAVLVDPALLLRLTDSSSYGPSALQERIGSGRLLFASANLQIWWGSDVTEFLMGIGRNSAMDGLEDMLGQRIFSHNYFVDVAIQDGLIGIVLYALFVGYLVRLGMVATQEWRSFAMAVLLAFISYQAVQGSNVFVLDLVVASVVAASIRNVESGGV